MSLTEMSSWSSDWSLLVDIHIKVQFYFLFFWFFYLFVEFPFYPPVSTLIHSFALIFFYNYFVFVLTLL